MNNRLRLPYRKYDRPLVAQVSAPFYVSKEDTDEQGLHDTPYNARVINAKDYVISMRIPSEASTYCLGDLENGERILQLLEQVTEQDREIVESMQFHQPSDQSVILDFVGRDRAEAQLRMAEWLMSQFSHTETLPTDKSEGPTTLMEVLETDPWTARYTSLPQLATTLATTPSSHLPNALIAVGGILAPIQGQVPPSKYNTSITSKQEYFAQLVALHSMNHSEAYREAYNADNSSDSTVWREASIVANNPKVWQRIQELRLHKIDGSMVSSPIVFMGAQEQGRHPSYRQHLDIIRENNEQDQTPKLARAIMHVMENRDRWEGTATELLSDIGWGWDGIPTIPNRLSNELLQTYITDALKDQDIKIERKRIHHGKRIIDIHRMTQAPDEVAVSNVGNEAMEPDPIDWEQELAHVPRTQTELNFPRTGDGTQDLLTLHKNLAKEKAQKRRKARRAEEIG